MVRSNIKLTLPHLSENERLAIEIKFYKHMCDMFLEMIKTLNISEKEMKKRFIFTNVKLVLELEKKNKSIVLMCAHYASWEWMIILGKYINFKGFGIYKRIRNPYFDKLVRDIRSKFDATLIDTKTTIKTVNENQEKGIMGIYGFVSDQTPVPYKTHYWQNFMGHEVPVHTGGEMLAKKTDMNVLYLKVEKLKRGHYQATFIPLGENVTNIPNYDISRDFLKEVEKQIYAAPEYYFWTHKRWKFRRDKE
ncbi:putative lipid A biosynthesis acyltransferase [Flavobacterium cauense R2A-7]|nr:putative lipid A biosynthesis acyltransferase [Flavobacterium cauense R2A-7]